MKMKRISITLMAAFALAGFTACADDGDGGDTDGDTDGDTNGDGDFEFATDDVTAYTQVDRIGMPGVAAAVITSKDAYNEASPANDAAGDYLTEIGDNLTAIHDALDDDLVGAGLTPCAVADCVDQAGPLVVPDTIKVDTALPAGFPNGRMLPDQVMDVTLAVVLLDLSVPPQTATTLAELPLNPTENDKPFEASFPYLATPHE